MSEHVHSGVGGNSPLQERTDSDRNDNDEEVDGLEENAYGKIPEVTNYIQPWAKWDSGTVEKLTKEVQDEGRELDNIASSEDFQSNAQERAGIDDPDPRCSAKACRLAGLVIGVPAGLGTLAVIILAIAGVFNAAKKMEDSTTTPTDPQDPTDPQKPNDPSDPASSQGLYDALAKAARDADSQPFWMAYKVAVDQFKAGLEVQKEAAAYVLSVSAPGFYMTYGTKPFLDSKAYQDAAKAIADKVLDKSNKDPLLHYDLVNEAAVKPLALNIKDTDIDERPRVLRLGLLLVVIEELIARMKAGTMAPEAAGV